MTKKAPAPDRRPAAMLPRLRLEENLCFAVYRAGHAFNAAYKPLLKPLGLTYPQYLAMLVLWERDGLSVMEIGGRLELDSGTLTPLLKRMEAAGLVRRARDADDERQVRVRLTPAGEALRVRAEGVQEALSCVLAGTLAPDEGVGDLQTRLDRVSGRLRKASVGEVDAAAAPDGTGRRRGRPGGSERGEGC